MTLSANVPAEILREASTPVLETERLVLRAPRFEDSKAVVELINDRRIAEMTARIPHPYTLADAEGFIATANRTGEETCFVITLRDGTPVGGCGLMRGDGDVPELGHWIGVAHWGRGYATEAIRAAIDYAFDELEHQALTAGARVVNPASRRVLEKCGFQWTGVVLTRIRAIQSSAPIDRFRIDRGLWASLKSWGATRRLA